MGLTSLEGGWKAGPIKVMIENNTDLPADHPDRTKEEFQVGGDENTKFDSPASTENLKIEG